MINKAILIGNLGADPEMRTTQSGNNVAQFTIATTEKFKGQNGQVQEHTEWHRTVAWGRLAEICGEYLKKGSRVYIEGKIQTRKWQAQDGSDRYTTEIVAREMKMLSVKGAGGNGGQYSGNSGGLPPEPAHNDSYSGTGDDVPF